MTNDDNGQAISNLMQGHSPLDQAKTEVSVRFLLDIFNLAPHDSPIRARVINAITVAGQRNAKAHWARGLLLTGAGDLVFDEARYLHAVYQGKQDTYAKAAQQAFDDLQRALSHVGYAQEKERIAIEDEARRAPAGRPLADFTVPTPPAALLKSAADALPTFVDRMAGGIDVTMGAPSRIGMNDQ